MNEMAQDMNCMSRTISPKKETYVHELMDICSLANEHNFVAPRTYVHRPSNICSPKSPLFGNLMLSEITGISYLMIEVI